MLPSLWSPCLWSGASPTLSWATHIQHVVDRVNRPAFLGARTSLLHHPLLSSVWIVRRTHLFVSLFVTVGPRHLQWYASSCCLPGCIPDFFCEGGEKGEKSKIQIVHHIHKRGTRKPIGLHNLVHLRHPQPLSQDSGACPGDNAKPLTALQAKMSLHLWNHATSAARTTKCALLFPLRARLACFSAAPLRSAAVRLAVLSRCKGDTGVVSMASCALCRSVKPSATNSSLRPSSTWTPSRSMSWTKVWTSLSPLLLCTSVRLPAQVESPRPPPHCTLLDCGQQSRVGGHIGRCVGSREGAIRGVATAENGRVETLVILFVGTASELARGLTVLASERCRGTADAHTVGFVHPNLLAGFWGVGSGNSGAVPQHCPRRELKPCLGQVCHTRSDRLKTRDGSLAIPCTMVAATVGWRSCTTGRQSVSPPPGPAWARRPRPPTERKRSCDSGHIMTMRECFYEVRSHTPQPGPRGSAHQQQPCCLWILHCWNALEQNRMSSVCLSRVKVGL